VIRHSDINATPDDLAVAKEIADLLRLDGPSRLYMLLSMRCLLENGQVVTAADWREAYGKAADFQMVRDARELLEVVS
jgi:hypothetical protein